MNVGYDSILTSTVHVVKLREIIVVASAATLLTVSCNNYRAWVAHREDSTPSTYILRNDDSYTQ